MIGGSATYLGQSRGEDGEESEENSEGARVLHDCGIGGGKVDVKLASGNAKDQRLGMGTGHCLEEEVSIVEQSRLCLEKRTHKIETRAALLIGHTEGQLSPCLTHYAGGQRHQRGICPQVSHGMLYVCTSLFTSSAARSPGMVIPDGNVPQGFRRQSSAPSYGDQEMKMPS